MSIAWSPDYKFDKHLVNLTDGVKAHKELCPACGDALTGKEANKGILCVACAASERQIRAHERAAVLAECRESIAEIRNDAYYKDDFEGGQALDQLLTLLFAPGGPLCGKGGE